MAGKRKYTLNKHVFDIIDTPVKAYWLGYLYCDGNVYIDKYIYRITLNSVDLDIIQKFRDFLETNQPIGDGVTKQHSGKISVWFVLQISSKHLAQTLMKYGIIPRKTYNHSIPVYIPPGNLESHFWRGCIDADGSVIFRDNYYCTQGSKKYGPYNRGMLTLNNSNIDLLNKCKEFFRKGTIQPHSQSPLISTWSYERKPSTITPVLDLIYKDAPKNVRLERKYEKYLEISSI